MSLLLTLPESSVASLAFQNLTNQTETLFNNSSFEISKRWCAFGHNESNSTSVQTFNSIPQSFLRPFRNSKFDEVTYILKEISSNHQLGGCNISK